MGQIGTSVVHLTTKKGGTEITHDKDNSALSTAMEQIIENGFDGLNVAVSILVNEAMCIECRRALEAEPWQRTKIRKGYANGYKPKSVESRIGKFELKVPQVRGPLQFYTNALERGLRSERALKLAIAEMYIKRGSLPVRLTKF